MFLFCLLFISQSVECFLKLLGNEAADDLDKLNDAVGNAKKNLADSAYEARQLADQTGTVAGNFLNRTKDMVEGSIIAGTKAAEKATEKQIDEAGKIIDSKMHQAGDVANQHIRGANQFVSEKRDEMEKVKRSYLNCFIAIVLQLNNFFLYFHTEIT